MMPRGRVLYACLDLLDRQLLDRNGTPCGNVDDLELDIADDGNVYVAALLTGPGMLAYRLKRRRLGGWLRRTSHALHPGPNGSDRTRVAIGLAYEIGPAVRIAVDAEELASHDLEGWTREHVIDNIPGARSAPE
jgi:hypothetical protein